MAIPPSTSLCLSLDSTLQPLLHHSPHLPSIASSSSNPLLSLHKSHSSTFKFLQPISAHPQTVVSTPKAGYFIDAAADDNRQTLDSFSYAHDFPHGSLHIRQMRTEELDSTVHLLAESFAESMWMPERYVSLLAFMVKGYVMDRRLLVPHTVTLVGYYKKGGGGGGGGGDGDGEEPLLACTAEISFNATGANAAPPTPTPPKVCPYICNMTVQKKLRRRGIGWELLKACEELISKMKCLKTVYLHCRVVDTVPFKMYIKAGYKVLKTDSVLVWFSLQRRKHLMFKELPVSDEKQPDDTD